MIIKRFGSFLKDPVIVKLISFSTILFFIFLGEAIMSFWVPNLLQDALKSSFKMGLVMSFASIAGFLMDLIFPQAIKNMSVKRLVTFSASFGIIFSIILLGSLKMPLLVIFLVAMAIWGIYYEFLGFAEQQFVADSIPYKMHSVAWAVSGIFSNLAYFLGPLVAAWLVVRSDWYVAVSAIFFTFIALMGIQLMGKTHERVLDFNFDEVNLWAEIKHWKVLFRHVWPVILLSLMLGIIDATFWTTGAVFTAHLTRQNFIGGFFLSLYQLPSLFIGLVLAKLDIYKGKKKLATKYLLISGLVLITLGFTSSVYLILFEVLVASILMSVSFPLTNSVYSDIVARMGVERKHLIGLCKSSMSLAYIIGPIIAGFFAKLVGESMTFTLIGGIAVAVTIFLLIVTPRKIRLPEREIQSWR